MKKKISGNVVLYSIAWSEIVKYDRHSAARKLPELPGVLFLYEAKKQTLRNLLVYGCWRTGLRMGMRDLMDPMFVQNQPLYEYIKDIDVAYKYCIVDSSADDLQDIMYWLIAEYTPSMNNLDVFKDSRRYREISVKESIARAGDMKLEPSNFGF